MNNKFNDINDIKEVILFFSLSLSSFSLVTLKKSK